MGCDAARTGFLHFENQVGGVSWRAGDSKYGSSVKKVKLLYLQIFLVRSDKRLQRLQFYSSGACLCDACKLSTQILKNLVRLDSATLFSRQAISLETRRLKYEEFLRHLLQKPTLKGSDLLHMFLTTNQDFTLIVTTAVPVSEDLSNIYQSVAFKLRKEKGQHLDNFMVTFITSTLKPQSK